MTAPSGEPGLDPTTPPAPPAPGAPAPQPTSTPPTGQDPSAPIDFDNLPPNLKAYVAQLRNEAGGYRQAKNTAEQTATAATQRLEAVLKAAGLNPDGTTAPPDPEQLAAQLRQRAVTAEERAQAEADKAWGAAVKLQLFRSAGQLGADPEALLDSSSFVDSLDEIADDDPETEAFRTALAVKITAALKANPKLATPRPGPTRMGADITGSGGGNTARPRSLREAFARKGS